jgi:RNA polymerase sigma-70 factor (ECF subfamily)
MNTLSATDQAATVQVGFDPARLVERHQSGVWRYLRALGCDPVLAEDLTQDTFLAVLRQPFEEYSEAATAAYLRRTARNLYVNSHRRAGKVLIV